MKRLEAVFEPEAFSALYPETEKAPKVFLGFPTTEPPFYVAVDEIAETVTTEGAATMGHDTVSFVLHVWVFAQHASLVTASNTMLAYVDAVFGAVMADPRLCGTVDNAFPVVDRAGTDADSSKRYMAAALIEVECTTWSACPAALQGIVARANEEFESEESNGSDGG